MRPTLRQLANTPQRRAPVTILASPRVAVAPYVGPFAERPFRFSGLGITGAPVIQGVVGTGGGAAATSIAAWAGAGSVAGPIGTVVGAVLGLVAGAFLNKNYLNVAQANTGEDNAVAAFNQYRNIAGQVPGRQFGVDAMNAIWDGAVYSGLFALNNGRACFHEGCLKYPGDPDWVWGTFHDGTNNRFTFAYAYQQWIAARQAGSLAAPAQPAPSPYIAAGVTSTTNLPPPVSGGQSTSVAPMMNVTPVTSAPVPVNRAGITAMRGLGRLGQNAAPQVPDAVTFIDQFFIPNAQADSPPWAVPSSPLEHQILYDAADAYLAQQPIVTTPYVASTYLGTSIATAPVVMGAASSTPGGIASSNTPGTGANFLAPVATPQLPATPIAVAASGGAVTNVTAATSANLDAALAAQGFTRVGTTSSGFPLYSQAGQVYAYQNGQLYPAGSVAQLAMTGGAGTGIATPATGLDPNTLAAIQAAVAGGLTASQAANVGAQQLAAQGVPITPDVQAQLQTAAQQPVIQPGPSSGVILLGIGAVVAFVLLTGHKSSS